MLRPTAPAPSNTAATVLGGIVRGTEISDAAVVFEGAGAVGRSMTSGKDYTAEVRFICEHR